MALVETTTIVGGVSAEALAEELARHFPRMARRHYEGVEILLSEREPRWFGCSSTLIVMCSDVADSRCRLYIVECGGWHPAPPRTSTKRYAAGAEVFRKAQEICEVRGWSMGDIEVRT